jgi:transglutaminase-like putative cysteine protease
MDTRTVQDPMRFEVSHRTTYSYRRPVAQSHHLVHLQPRHSMQQRLIHHSLLIEPAPVSRVELTDTFGNVTEMLRIKDEHSEFIVHARSTVEIMPSAPPLLADTMAWEDVVALAALPGTALDLDVVQFAMPSRHTPVSRAVIDFAFGSFHPRRPVLAAAMDLTTRIFREFKFDPTATDVSTPIARVLESRRGVCQDFAHLSLATLRSLGIPARYVSGYLLTRPPPGQVKLKGSDASHAWISVYAPQTGWVDFDPTNGLIPSGEHITVAYGRDYDDISPVSGVLLGGGDQTMTIAVDVEPVM